MIDRLEAGSSYGSGFGVSEQIRTCHLGKGRMTYAK